MTFSSPYGPEFPLDGVEEHPGTQLKFVWSIVFTLLWGMILQSLFFGHIINAFNTLLAERRDKETDSEQRCLVCSLERNVFELRREEGFNEHVQHHHNPLHYVFFVNALMRRDVEDMDGLESHCYDALELSSFDKTRSRGGAAATSRSSGSADSAWIPVNRACVL
jgi:hypothetical protein